MEIWNQHDLECAEDRLGQFQQLRDRLVAAQVAAEQVDLPPYDGPAAEVSGYLTDALADLDARIEELESGISKYVEDPQERRWRAREMAEIARAEL